MNGETRVIYSVSEILQTARILLEAKFPHALVQGEITDFKHHSSGHMYFSLKDEKGVLRCAFFKGNNFGLAFKPENVMTGSAWPARAAFPRCATRHRYRQQLERP